MDDTVSNIYNVPDVTARNREETVTEEPIYEITQLKVTGPKVSVESHEETTIYS